MRMNYFCVLVGGPVELVAHLMQLNWHVMIDQSGLERLRHLMKIIDAPSWSRHHHLVALPHRRRSLF